MTPKEMKSIKNEIESRFSGEFEKIAIGDRECYKLKDGRVICVTLITSWEALVIEYAENADRAKLNSFEDGDLFYLADANAEDIFKAMLQEIAS